LELELQRIDLAVQQAQIELEAIKSQEEYIQSQKEMYERLLEDAQQREETNEKLIEKYKKIVEETNDPAKKQYALAMVETFSKAYETAQQDIVKYSARLSEVLELKQKELSLEQQITSLQDAKAKIAEKINRLSSEGETPTYEQKLQQLNKLIEEQKRKLDEYTSKSGEAYEADLEMLRLYIAQKQNLLRASVQYMTEQMEAPEYKVAGTIEITDFSQIEKSFEALDRLIEQHNEEASEQLYRNLRSQIVSALTRAYIEGDKEAITKLEQHFAKIESYADIFTPKVDIEQIKKQIELLKDALYSGKEDVAQSIYSDISAILSKATVEAFTSGNEELLRQLEEQKNRLDTIIQRYQKFQQTVQDTAQIVTHAGADTDDALERQARRWKDYATNLEIAKIKEKILGAELEEKISLYEQLIDKYKELGMDVSEYTKKLEQLKTVQEKMKNLELDERNRLEAAERAREIERELQILVAKAATERRYAGYNVMIQINELKKQLAGATLEEKIQIYEKLIDKYKELGLSAAEYEKQIERLNERLKKQNELDEENLRKNEAYHKTMQELTRFAAERATSQRYANWNEMVQIQQQKLRRKNRSAPKDLESSKNNRRKRIFDTRN